jgi:hypothetical protein
LGELIAMAPRIHPPFAQPDPGRRATPTARVEAELPPIEEFLDDLPSIDEFLLPEERAAVTPDWSETSLYRPSPSAQPRVQSRTPQRSVQTTPPDIDNEGWAVSDWQSYDWSEVASLGAPAPEAVEANAAWSSTDWSAASRRLTDLATRPGGLPAEDVAAALDEMARRIRTGELSLERFHGTPPEAAIAAVFAALLRTRG